MLQGLQHKSDEVEMRELGVFSLEKKRSGEDLISLYNYMKEVVVRWGLSILPNNK